MDVRPAWDPAEFGDTWAEVYDEAFAHLDADAEQAVAFLTGRRPQRGRLLELGVGTGRLAIPLADQGFAVTGVDASARMLEVLSAKPGGHAVACVVGDMVAPPVTGTFDVVLITFNSLFALPDQASQVRCLQACATLLAEGGELVIEASVPQPWRFDGAPHAGEVRDDQVALELADHDPVTQTVRAAQVLISDRLGIRTLPVKMRYAWPAEIDLMARIAGLDTCGRWAGWCGEDFDGEAQRHVSCYHPTGSVPGAPGDGPATEKVPCS